MKTKILIVTPYPVDANSFWRCMGPMSYMAKHFEEFSITLSEMNKGGTISWVEVGQYDMIFMHRPCRPDDLIIMQIAYNMNIPVWVDYDDWLFEIPSWNPNAQLYNNMAMQSNMAQALACADIVSVSTTELYNQYRAVNPNTVIIPNAYRSDLFKFRKENLEERNDFALWRGSNTHDGDLLSAFDLDEAETCIRKYLLEVATNTNVRQEHRSELVLGCKPRARPRMRDADTEAVGVHFLTHNYLEGKPSVIAM